MAIRRRTTCYEPLVEVHSCFKAIALRRALVELFAFMLLAVGSIWNNLSPHCVDSDSPYQKPKSPLRVLHPDTLQEMKRLEDEVHLQASRYMQLKQIEMLEQLQRDQSTLAEKVEDLVEAKMRKVEERLSAKVRGQDEDVSSKLVTPPTSQEVEHDADVLRNVEMKAKYKKDEEKGTE